MGFKRVVQRRAAVGRRAWRCIGLAVVGEWLIGFGSGSWFWEECGGEACVLHVLFVYA